MQKIAYSLKGLIEKKFFNFLPYKKNNTFKDLFKTCTSLKQFLGKGMSQMYQLLY